MPLPRVGLGCMRLSTEPRDAAEAIAVIHAALDAGVLLFDTATAYCALDELGENERLLRRAFASHPRGAQAIVVTKGGLRRPGGAWRPDGRARSLLEDAERSAEALGRAPDVFLLHAPDPSVPFATSIRALKELVDRGLARRIGVSNVSLGQLDEALGLAPIEVVQQGLSVFDDRARRSGVLGRCVERGLELMAHTPLGGPKRIARLGLDPLLRALASEHGTSPACVALAALLHLGPAISAIPGARRPKTIVDAARAAAITLSAQALSQLKERFPALGAPEHLPIAAANQRAEVVLLMGIQGSGKSRLVEEYVANGFARFNRDELHGTLKDVAQAVSRALEKGVTHAVLDNTYTTRASRSAAIEAAQRHGARVRGLWLDTPLHEAQVNVILRMLSAHGRLLGPAELKARRDNTGLSPLAHFRTVRELEPPHRDEGFDVLEHRAFVRAASPGVAARFVAVEIAHLVEPAPEPTVVFGWTLDRAPLEHAAARLGATVACCPHGGGPPSCWCRPPLPGLLLEACHQRGLSPSSSVLFGATEVHQLLAATVGARYVQAGP